MLNDVNTTCVIMFSINKPQVEWACQDSGLWLAAIDDVPSVQGCAHEY